MNKKLLPLIFLDEADNEEIEGITRFQKLIFIYQNEVGEEIYKFRPDSYGPFSRPLYDDLDWLSRENFIDCKEVSTGPENENIMKKYSLNNKGKTALRNARDTSSFENIQEDIVEEIASEYNNLSLWELLERVYDKSPKMTTESKLNI